MLVISSGKVSSRCSSPLASHLQTLFAVSFARVNTVRSCSFNGILNTFSAFLDANRDIDIWDTGMSKYRARVKQNVPRCAPRRGPCKQGRSFPGHHQRPRHADDVQSVPFARRLRDRPGLATNVSFVCRLMSLLFRDRERCLLFAGFCPPLRPQRGVTCGAELTTEGSRMRRL